MHVLRKYLISCLILAVGSAYGFELPRTAPKEAPANIPNFVAFNANLYELAYTTFLASGDLHNAFYLTQQAVHEKPDAIKWRERYANISEWTGRNGLALEEWLTLFHKTHSYQATSEAIRLAEELQNYSDLVMLYQYQLRHRGSPEIIIPKLSQTFINQGKPEKALALLEKNKEQLPNLIPLIELQIELGKLPDALKTTSKSKRQEHSVRYAMARANVLLMQHDTKNAYQALKKMEAYAPTNDNEYWQTLGHLASQEADRSTALNAYKHLYNNNQKTEDNLTQYSQLLRQEKSGASVDVSVELWERFPKLAHLSKALESALDQQHWKTIQTTMKRLTQKQTKELEETPLYYTVTANLQASEKQYDAAIVTYQKALHLWPNDTSLIEQYLWQLIAQKNKPQLREALPRYADNKALENVVTNGYIALREYNIALKRYQAALPLHQNNPDWLLDYADRLQEVHSLSQANFIRQKAWRLMMKQASPDPTTLIRLGYYKFPGISPRALLKQLQENPSQIGLEQFLIQSLDNQQTEFAQSAKLLAQQQQLILSPKTHLQLALATQDSNQLHQLVRQDGSTEFTPIEKLDAHRLLGDEQISQTLAYENLEAYPDDHYAYQQFQDLILPKANFVAARLAYRQFGLIQGLEYILEGRYQVFDRIKVTPFIQQWRIHSKTEEELTNIPSYDKNYQVGLSYQTQVHFIELVLGERSTLKSFFTALLAIEKQSNERFNYRLEIGKDQRSDESTLLLLGGKKNHFKASINYVITPNNNLAGLFQYSEYHGLNDIKLGHGQTAFIAWRHNITNRYPDWNVLGYTSLGQYHSSGKISPTLNRLIPFSNPTNNLYLPEKFLEIGALVGFAQRFEEDYTHKTRLFGEIGILHNTVNGLGEIGRFGLAGTLIGSDHVALFVNFSKNQGTRNQVDYTLGGQYRVYL